MPHPRCCRLCSLLRSRLDCLHTAAGKILSSLLLEQLQGRRRAATRPVMPATSRLLLCSLCCLLLLPRLAVSAVFCAQA